MKDARESEADVVTFERRLSHRPEKVWRALTSASELSHWFPADVEGELEEGAALSFAPREPDDAPCTGVVTECDPPRVLAFTMGHEALRWELEPTREGCILRLTTRLVVGAENDNAAPRASLAA